MEIKINKNNSAGNPHGYWDDNDSYYIIQGHYYNDDRVGYMSENNSFTKWNTHYLNDKEIGCELQHSLFNEITTQWYFKTPGNKFGEEIRWK